MNYNDLYKNPRPKTKDKRRGRSGEFLIVGTKFDVGMILIKVKNTRKRIKKKGPCDWNEEKKKNVCVFVCLRVRSETSKDELKVEKRIYP